MRVVDRLYKYMEYKQITAYAVEKACRIANGYLGKQKRGKGSIGSEILEKICRFYDDIDITWLIVGEGDMILENARIQNMVSEDKQFYSKDEMIEFLKGQVSLLQAALEDKRKIIAMMEKEVKV
jgi:transcriptional regulator with XRE-family HTH domain